MTTRKNIMSNQYLRLTKNVDNILDKHNVLPNIDDHDFCDILYMFNVYFMDCTENNYKEKIDNLLNIASIKLTYEELHKIYEPIYNFVKWYKNLN